VGALFRNEKKDPESKQPDYTGVVKVDGRDRRLAAWIKTGSKSGNVYLSLKVSEFEEKRESSGGVDLGLDDEGSRALRKPKQGVSDDEIPF
jgi:hypothetical protein